MKLSEEEKRVLSAKVEEMREVDVKVEREVIEKFGELLRDISGGACRELGKEPA